MANCDVKCIIAEKLFDVALLNMELRILSSFQLFSL